MRWQVIAVSSVGVNVLLAAAWMVSSRHSAARAPFGAAANAAAEESGRTNYVVRRQLFSWHEVESPDYPTYIANLHDINCPEQTIRDIIIADVNALYERRRATELLTPQQQWWRSEPDTNVVRALRQKAHDLDEERRALLTRLLGPNWDTGEPQGSPRSSPPTIALDGPVLGLLAPEIKKALQDINARSQERLTAYLAAQRHLGKEPDPTQLAKLRQQTRDELASVLSPPQLEEYLLRYSQYASNLRAEFGTLKYFNATPDEFRAVFRATDALDQRIELLAGATDAYSVQARKSLEAQAENAIKLALGSKRYEDYRRLQDPLYRDAMAAALQAGTPEAVETIYMIDLAAAQEQQSIRSNASLTAEQKNIALRSLELEQLKANAIASGQELPPEPPPEPAAKKKRTYTLRPGDTAGVVAMIYGVPESAIRAANPGVDFSRLKPGASINIPQTALTPIGAPLTTPGPAIVPPTGP